MRFASFLDIPVLFQFPGGAAMIAGTEVVSLLSAAPGRRWWGCSPRPLHVPPPRSLVIPASLRLRLSELLWEPTRCRCLRGTCGWCPGSQSEAAAASVGREGTRQTGRVAAPPGAAGPREAGVVPWRAEAPGGLSSGRLTVVAAVLSVCWFPPLAVLPLASGAWPSRCPCWDVISCSLLGPLLVAFRPRSSAVSWGFPDSQPPSP